jgi:hypothetical protein
MASLIGGILKCSNRKPHNYNITWHFISEDFVSVPANLVRLNYRKTKFSSKSVEWVGLFLVKCKAKKLLEKNYSNPMDEKIKEENFNVVIQNLPKSYFF